MSSRVAAMADNVHQLLLHAPLCECLRCTVIPEPASLRAAAAHRAALPPPPSTPSTCNLPFVAQGNFHLFAEPRTVEKKDDNSTATRVAVRLQPTSELTVWLLSCSFVCCSCGSGFTDWSRKAAEEAWGRCAKQGECALARQMAHLARAVADIAIALPLAHSASSFFILLCARSAMLQRVLTRLQPAHASLATSSTAGSPLPLPSVTNRRVGHSTRAEAQLRLQLEWRGSSASSAAEKKQPLTLWSGPQQSAQQWHISIGICTTAALKPSSTTFPHAASLPSRSQPLPC